MDTARRYLDNAATSYPKPETVWSAVDQYNRRLGAAVGRGGYRRATEIQSLVDRCRKRAADLLGAEGPERIIFTFNGTDGLNLALHGLLEPGDHVVTSSIEHNSVRRPLREWRDRSGVEVTEIQADREGRLDPARFREAIRPETKLVAVIHASNVVGTVQPIVDIGEVAREAGALVLVDAAQSAGHLPIDLSDLPVDLLACPGHKGLLGPLGTGLLYVRPGVEEPLRSLRQGGTGSISEDDHQPDSLPDKYEAGNHNAPGLCGLEAGLAFLQETTVASVREHERELTAQLLEELSRIGGVTVYGPKSADERVGVVSLTVTDFEPHDLATILDDHFAIQTRAGLHCAPGAHRAIGTFDRGGTVRLSLGPFNGPEDIAAVAGALREIAG